jgi:protocatechuate 3,4-dioxygenase beta subunit
MTEADTEPRQIYDPIIDTPSCYVREEGVHPPLDSPEYKSTQLRHPKQPLIFLPQNITELTGPALGSAGTIGELDHDLTRQHEGEPIGERMTVSGRVFDNEGKPLRNTLVEIWQANACGRYRHRWDRFPAPLDPNFTGAGRCETDDEGRYRFVTVKPGPYPWGNHYNAWRPAHIHFSLFGPAFAARLITQMYFPDDPLLGYDPIYNSVPEGARKRLQASFDMATTRPEWALAYKFDIVLRGRNATPME